MKLSLKISKNENGVEDTVYIWEGTVNAGKLQVILPIDGIPNEDESCKLTGITLTLESELTKKPVYRDDVKTNEED